MAKSKAANLIKNAEIYEKSEELWKKEKKLSYWCQTQRQGLNNKKTKKNVPEENKKMIQRNI